MSVVLETGPSETFLFDSPGGTTTNHLPEGLKDLEAGVGPGRPIQAIYSLSFGYYGAYVLGARNSNGAIIRRNNLPPQLESWLIDPHNHSCKRDIATLGVEFGPNGSFYARDKDSYRWHNLPDALEEAIQQRLCPAGWMARPEFIRLGADGAFIYSNDRGGCSHALGNYPKLQELILWLQRSNVGGLTGFSLVQSVSMSLHRPGQFILLLTSSQHFAELSPTATQALNSMAGTFPTRHLPPPQAAPQRAVSQPLSPTSQPPMRHGSLPIRKPVGSAAGQPRPPPQHLVSSPIPQAQPSRPVSYAQSSAPAVPQVQNQAVRPVSMQLPAQVPGRVADVQQQQQQQVNNANFTYAYNTNTNTNYSTTSTDTNSGGTTYVVAPDGGTASPPPTYIAPYYPVDTTSNTTVVDTNSPISSPPPTYVSPSYSQDTIPNSTIVENNNSTIYDTTSNGTYIPINSVLNNSSIFDSNTATSPSTETDTYSTTIVDTTTSSNIYDASNTTIDDATTYTSTAESTVYDASTGDTATYDTTVSSTVDETVVMNSSGTGGDGGGFWGALLS